MEHMKFEIILGAGQEGLITSDFDGELKKIRKPDARSGMPELEGSEKRDSQNSNNLADVVG